MSGSTRSDLGRGATIAIGWTLILVTGISCASEDTAGPNPSLAGLAAAVTTPVFRQISAGGSHSCGVTPENKAYCWGFNSTGQLGDGTLIDRLHPVPVLGGLAFRNVSAGHDYTCGLTTQGLGYCWGANSEGQLGDGTTTWTLTPVAVAGGQRFLQLDVGGRLVCARRDPDGRAYCWGNNTFGQVGDGTTVTRRLLPVAVAGGRVFSLLSSGGTHACGVTPLNQIYCWGDNREGQIGDGTLTQRRVPTRVAGQLEFVKVDAGRQHTCAVTSSFQAYCWGNGNLIGDGIGFTRRLPRAVAGGLRFARVTAAASHTCGVTTAKQTYCWGSNNYGQLGDGTLSSGSYRLTPVAVIGGIAFVQLSGSVDGAHTCGKTLDNEAYCWGANGTGELGDGTRTNRSSPVAVAAGP